MALGKLVQYEFAGFLEQTYTAHDRFRTNGPYGIVWQNRDQARTNQNDRVCLKTHLPYNNMYH